MIEEKDLLPVLERIISKTNNEAPYETVAWWKESELARVYDSLRRYACILNLIPKSPRILKTLDIGIGFGHLAILIKRIFGYAVTGIDCETTEFLQKRFKEEKIGFRFCDLTKEPIPFPNFSFNIVLFCDILHLLPIHPKKIFDEMNRVLKERGILILETRNFLSIYNRIKILFGKTRTNWNEKYPHFRLYTINELRYLLNKSGFKIEEAFLCNTLNESMSAIRLSKLKRSAFFLGQILCKIKPSFRDSIMIKATKRSRKQSSGSGDLF
jgi:ubiquinone/menaquinone biosynthesis C-methylase UbiE